LKATKKIIRIFVILILERSSIKSYLAHKLLAKTSSSYFSYFYHPFTYFMVHLDFFYYSSLYQVHHLKFKYSQDRM